MFSNISVFIQEKFKMNEEKKRKEREGKKAEGKKEKQITLHVSLLHPNQGYNQSQENPFVCFFGEGDGKIRK